MKFIFLVLSLFISSLCLAEDGQLGPTSTATVHISITVMPRTEVKYNSNGSYQLETNFKKEEYTEEVVSETKDSSGTVTKVIILTPKL